MAQEGWEEGGNWKLLSGNQLWVQDKLRAKLQSKCQGIIWTSKPSTIIQAFT